MKLWSWLTGLAGGLLVTASAHSAHMTQSQLEAMVKGKVNVEQAQTGLIVFNYREVRMMLVSDAAHDRMRIVSPIVEVQELTPNEIYILMESNFHRALDARYATSDGILYSAFIHPLSPLDETQLDSALNQVATLAQTYGSAYTSSELGYGGK